MSNTKIGLGLAALGRPDYINIRTDESLDKSLEAFESNAHEMLHHAYQNGVRDFDTAPSYGKGEEFLIDWNNSHSYEGVALSTKWGYTYVANWEIGYKGEHEVKEHSLSKLLDQWKQSKTLLPNLKVYQVHSATFESGILENQEVLNQLFAIKEQTGLQIGITTSGVNQKEVIKSALAISIDGKALFDSFQVTFNVLEQSTFEILKTVLQSGKTVIIKEALANGRVFQKQETVEGLYSSLNFLALKYNVGIDAVALRFVMDYLQPHVVLSGASTKVQLNQNLKANTIRLTAEEIQKLSSFAIQSEDYWGDRKALVWN